MPVVTTKYFGPIPYEGNAEIEFPWGVPGFEDRRLFVAIRFPRTDPLVFLQSMEDPELCFIALAAQIADPGYRLSMSEADLRRLQLPIFRQPRIGHDVQCLTVLAVRETGPTANLLAPVVINLRTMKAVQAIACDSQYSHCSQLRLEWATLCS